MVAAAAIAVGSVAGAAISAGAASDAANAQLQAAQSAQQTQLQMFNQSRGDLSPYNQFGQSVLPQLSTAATAQQSPLNQLASLYGVQGPNASGSATGPNAANAMAQLQQFPGYQFALQQGGLALDRSAASRGLLLSGGQLKDAQSFGQGLASQQFGNYVSGLGNYNNQLQGYIGTLNNLAGLGENAAAQTGQQAIQTGQGVAQSQLAAGQAAASGIVGSANALSAGIGGGVNNGLFAYGLGNRNQSSYNPSAYLNTGSGGVAAPTGSGWSSGVLS